MGYFLFWLAKNPRLLTQLMKYDSCCPLCTALHKVKRKCTTQGQWLIDKDAHLMGMYWPNLTTIPIEGSS